MTGRRRIFMRGSRMTRPRMARCACARRVMGRSRRFGFCRGSGSEKRQSGSGAYNPFLHMIEPPFASVFMGCRVLQDCGIGSDSCWNDEKSSGIRLVSGEGVMFSLWHYYIILYFALQGTKLYKKENICFDIHINFDIDFRSRGFPAIKNAPEGSGKRKDSVFGKGAVRIDGDRSRK